MPHQNDVFAKMDALMKKHHPGAVQPLPVDVRTTADIPVLTDIVAEAEPEIPVLTEMADAPELIDETLSEPHSTSPLKDREHAPESLESTVMPLAEKGMEGDESSLHSPSPLPSPARGEGADLEPDETEPVPAEPAPQAVEDQLPAELEDRIREQLVEQLAPPLAAALEKSLAGALDQFAMQIECLIRDAIAAEVRQQLAAFQADKASASARKTAD